MEQQSLRRRAPWLAAILAPCALLSAPSYAAQPGDPAVAFDITGFAVEGNTLLRPAVIQTALKPYAGSHRSFDAIEQAMAALQRLYRRRGYSLVKVTLPEQELKNGVVRLTVVETRIGSVRVHGNQFHGTDNVRRSLPGATEGAIPDTDALAADLKLANANPSKQVEMQVQGGTQPGTVDVVERVTDSKPWTATALLDNSGYESSGRDHVTAQYQYADLWGLDHVVSAQYTTSLEDPGSVRVYGAGYHIPLYGLGDTLDFYASYSTVNSGTVAAGPLDLSVTGAGAVFGMRFTHELPRLGAWSSQLIAGFDRKEFRNDVSYQGQPLGSDVTVDPLSLSYDGQWALSAGGINFYLTLARNIPGGSQGDDANFTTARAGGDPQYGMLRYGAGYTRQLPAQWLLRLTVNGQSTRDALVPGEQFGIGGATSVRGLAERQLTGDKGFTANVELHTPDLCSRLLDGVTHCNALTFLDDGHVYSNDALPGEPGHQSAVSTGVGLRLVRGRNLSLQMDYGRVVSASDPTQQGDQRLHASLQVSY